MRRPIERALVIGVTGQVGGALAERLSPERVVGADLSLPASGDPMSIWFDLAAGAANPDRARLLLAEAACDVVFIAAGFTWVDGCQRDPLHGGGRFKRTLAPARAAE